MAVYKPGTRGTIRSGSGYSIQDACVKLYEAMKGLGTDEAGVIDVISSHTFEERELIKKKYQVLYGKDLRKELDGELSFDFAKLVDSLMIDPEEYVLECIHKAISSKSKGGKLFKRFSAFFKEGLGASEYMLIGMLCIKNTEDLEAIKKAYKKKHGEELENKIAVDGNNMSHDVCSFIIDMISGEREADDKEWDDLDLDQLSDDCDELANCKSEDVLHSLLQERSFTYLRRLFVECLKNVTGKSIENFVDDLKGQISAELEEAYRAMIKLIVEGEAVYYAERVYEAIEGTGTDDDTLIKVVVHRSEIDLLDIMDIYEEKYKKEMVADVEGDTSGDYKDLLLKILKRPECELSEMEEETEREVGLNEEIKAEEDAVVVEKVDAKPVENHIEPERKPVVGGKSIDQQAEEKDKRPEVVEEKEIERVQVQETEKEVVCKEEKVEMEEDNKGTLTSEAVEDKVVEKTEEVNNSEVAEEGQGQDMEEGKEVTGEVEEKGEETQDIDSEIVEENKQAVAEMEHEQDIEDATLKAEEDKEKKDDENVIEIAIEQGQSDEVKSLEECNERVTGEENVEEVEDKKEESGDAVEKEYTSEEGSELPKEF